MPDSNVSLYCDVSTPRVRPFVTMNLRRAAFDSIHQLSHPGIKATMKLITECYVWPSVKRDCRHTTLPYHCLPSSRKWTCGVYEPPAKIRNQVARDWPLIRLPTYRPTGHEISMAWRLRSYSSGDGLWRVASPARRIPRTQNNRHHDKLAICERSQESLSLFETCPRDSPRRQEDLCVQGLEHDKSRVPQTLTTTCLFTVDLWQTLPRHTSHW